MKLQTSGAALFYEKSGEGYPIILLHGNGESHKIFKKAIGILERHFTVYAVDTRGHGKSSPVSELHYDDMAEDIYEFICGLELERPIVYGFSDGGIAALILSIRHPHILSKIIVSGVNTRPDGLKPALLRFYKLIYFLTRSSKLKLMLNEPDISDEMLNRICIPVHITAGSKDVIRKSHLENIASSIPGSTLTVFPGESHGSYVIDSEKIAGFILDKCKK